MKSLIFIISIILVFLFSGCGATVSTHTSKNTKEVTINSTTNMDTNSINKASVNIKIINEKLVTLANELENVNKKDVILKLLNDFKENSTLKTSSVFFGNESGDFYMTPIAELPGDYDPRARDWYKISKQSGGYLSDIYKDFSNNDKILTVGKGVYKNKKIIGVVAIDLILEK